MSTWIDKSSEFRFSQATEAYVAAKGALPIQSDAAVALMQEVIVKVSFSFQAFPVSADIYRLML